MDPYLLVGLTGSIGSGKSAAAAIFQSLGAAIIDADLLAREVVIPGTPALKAIVEHFGQSILASDGTLDRKQLGSKVFKNISERKALEAIVHPAIRELFVIKKGEFEQHRSAAQKILIYVVPLLFESNNRYPEIKKTIVVSAPRALCISRIMQRDSCSQELASQKLDSQIPIEEKERLADYIIKNDSSRDALEASVRAVYAELIRLT